MPGVKISASLDAGGDVVPMEKWRLAGVLREALSAAVIGVHPTVYAPPARGVRRKRLLIVRRTHSRRLANADEVAGVAARAGWEVVMARMEERTAAQQFALAAGADFAVHVHGSALSWALVASPWSTWMESLAASYFMPALLGSGPSKARSKGKKSTGVRHYRGIAAIGVN
eukprot:Hpha_TRINITY_DN24884_c0_g1::TRINITY_DN24884_c0_g1_i1::g.97283::m.97283